MSRFVFNFKRWNETYGILFAWGWRLILYPVLAVSLYAGKSYLDTNYVSRPYFDNAMATLATDKEKIAAEQKQDLREISAKLDTLIETRAVNTQRLTDNERRLARIEEKFDR